MTETVKVTHVFLTTGVMLHVVGTAEMVKHSLQSAEGMFVEVVVPIMGDNGVELGPILLNRVTVTMVTDDHDYNPSAVKAEASGDEDEVVMGS